MELYLEVISKYIEKGYIFKVIFFKIEEKVWYFLYFVIVRFEKIIIKIRVVFDVFVKFNGLLLNDVIC